MADSELKTPRRLSRGAMTLLHQIMTPDEEEHQTVIAKINTMSPEAQQAELATAGIDVAANLRRFHQFMAEHPELPERRSLAAGINKIITAAGEFLAVNREGLERLRRVYTPAVLDGDARNVQDALEEAGVAVAPISLTVAGGAVRLALRWRQDIPPKPPEVSVRVGGEARAAQSEWVGWNADASSLQGLRLHGLAVDKAALQAAGDKPVLACRWSAEANRLEIDLLPVEGDGDA